MKLLLSLSLILGLAFGAEGQPSDDSDQNTDGKSEELIWADEFNEDGAPSEKNWVYAIGNGHNGWGNREVQYYTDDPKNVHVEDGKLIINAIKEDGKWTSARIKTEGKQTFRHVTVKARAKLPKGSGTWPAIWLLGSNIDDVGWPSCGEIDIMEHEGKNPGLINCALHTPSSHGNTVNRADYEVPGATDEFHVYETVWTPDSITFKVDGDPYYTYNPEVKNEKTWPYNHDFYIIMNVAMGGYKGSDPQYETDGKKNGIDPELEKATMEVDYIRVYRN